jgi:hypothetical protein
MMDYDGPPEYDMELQEIIKRHLHQANDPRPESHMSQIFRCDDDTASKLDMETEVKKELMKNEIEVREMRNDLKEDALKCFSKHGRPKMDCLDYCGEDKTVGRKMGVPKEHRMYLCMFCPVQEYYQYKIRGAKGLYSTKSDTVNRNRTVTNDGAGGKKLWTPGS